MEDEGTEVDVEVAGIVEDVDVGSNKPVRGVVVDDDDDDDDDDVELVAVEKGVLIAVLTVEEGVSTAVLAVREVAEVRSLSLSSPQIPVSHGLVEQHPV